MRDEMATGLITSYYAVPIAILYLVLTFRVIGLRRRHAVALGDGGDPVLLRRIRAQANLTEYAPLILVLMLMGEIQGASAMLLHAIGIALLVGRLIHAFGISQAREDIRLRAAGMILTLTALIGGAFIAVLPHLI